MGAIFLGSPFFSFLTAEIFEKRVGKDIPSYVVLNNYQIKEVNDTEKGLGFKQILTQKTWSFAYLIELSHVRKLREVKEIITLYGRSVNQENKCWEYSDGYVLWWRGEGWFFALFVQYCLGL